MSTYQEIKTKFRDQDCLVKALNEMGYPVVEVHEDAQPLYGYRGDFRHKDQWSRHTTDPNLALKAHVIVRRKHVGSAANDLGFTRGTDGNFSAIVSDYDRTKHSDRWMNTLMQKYNVLLDHKVAKRHGYTVTKRETLPNGAVKLRLRR